MRPTLKRPLVSQGSLNRLLQAAGEAWQRHDFTQYFELMERACRSDPANHRILLDLGLAYGMRYDYPSAERCFEKALRLTPQQAEVLALIGTHCRNFGRYEMARHYFERAIQQPGATADSFAKLAELCERFRLLDQAAALVDKALKLDSRCPLARLVSARLARLAGHQDEAERLVRSLLAETDPGSWSTRIRGWYELGAILDRQGRFDEAMEAWLTAKELLRPSAAPYIASQQTLHLHLQQAAADISKDVLARWFECGQTLQPPHRMALLCGHPRSGTTLLEQVLDAHPEVISAEETPIFFETYLMLKRGCPDSASMLSVLDPLQPELLREARANYFRCMDLFHDRQIAGRLLIDKNPSLTTLIPAVIRVVPEAKFLVALRDPRDVCLSFFMQPLPLNLTSASYLSLEGTVAEYAALMGIWRAIGPRMRNPFIEVRYEDLVENLESVSKRVLEFLDLPWDARVLHFNEHAQKKLVRSPTYADVTRPISKSAVGRWRNYEKYLEPFLEKLAPFIKAFGYE
jgi:Tfp pilus assembly protein PilF